MLELRKEVQADCEAALLVRYLLSQGRGRRAFRVTVEGEAA